MDPFQIPEFDDDGNPVVMGWVLADEVGGEPMDPDDAVHWARRLTAEGCTNVRIEWIVDKPMNTRFDRVRNKVVV